MHLAVEIGQSEIRRIERSQRALAFRRRLAKAPCVMRFVRHDGLSKKIRQRRQVVAAAIDKLTRTRRGHRHADIAFAKSLRLELPSADPLEIGAAEPQRAARNVRIDAGSHAVAIYDVDSHLRLTLAPRFQHKAAAGTKHKRVSIANEPGNLTSNPFPWWKGNRN